MARLKLLITGHSGLIGGVLWRNLAGEFDLYGADICVGTQGDHTFRADISNFEQVQAVFEKIPGLKYVVHLAGDPGVEADWQSVWPNKIARPQNVFELAKEYHTQRVLFASSNPATGAYAWVPPGLHAQSNPKLISTKDPIRPDSYYGVSKATGEALARIYYELCGLESVCLRIGTVLREHAPTQEARYRSTWLSYRELVQLVEKSRLTDTVKFAIYDGGSNNKNRFWEISNAMADSGCRPEDDASTR